MYFDTKDQYDAAIAGAQAANNSQLVAQLREEFGRWKSAYLAQHPVFNEQLQSPTGRQRRYDTLEQLQEVKDDPRVKNRMDPHVRQVLDAWEEYEAAADTLQYQNGAAASRARKGLRIRIYNLLDQYTRENRSARAMFLRLIRPELNVEEDDLQDQAALSAAPTGGFTPFQRKPQQESQYQTTGA
jgi:hypothetical protein